MEQKTEQGRQPSVEELTLLGEKINAPQDGLECFDNPAPDRVYNIKIETDEVTCLCPKTGQPDFLRLEVNYCPKERCVESKSWKLYLWSFRDRKVFHEALIHEILDAFVKHVDPLEVEIKGIFNVRGGLYFTVEASYRFDK